MISLREGLNFDISKLSKEELKVGVPTTIRDDDKTTRRDVCEEIVVTRKERFKGNWLQF